MTSPPPLRKRSRGKAALVGAMLASAGAHLVAAWMTQRLPIRRLPTENRTAIEVTFARASNSTKPVPPSAQSADAPTMAPRKRAPEPEGRLVRLPPPTNKEKPADAQHVSEFDHAVKEEMHTRDVDPLADPAHERQKTRTNAAPTAAEETRSDVADLGARAGRSYLTSSMQLRAPKLLLASAPSSATFDLPAAAAPAPDVEEEDAADAVEDTVEDRGEGGRGFGDTRGARAGRDHLSLGSAEDDGEEGGAPVDLVEDGTEGTGVYLNALQRRHASFFNRLTDAVRRQWNPGRALRQRSERERMSQPPKRFTLLEIVLDRAGRVVAVRTDRYCGADYLDDEAARAVRAAGPFGPPPTPLFEGADQFSFRFGFTVHFDRGYAPAFPWSPRGR